MTVFWSPANDVAGAAQGRVCSGMMDFEGIWSNKKLSCWDKSWGCGCINGVLAAGKELVAKEQEERQWVSFHRTQSCSPWRDVWRGGCKSGVRCE